MSWEGATALEVLASERDIRHQLHRYCRAVNESDRDLLKSIWHLDGTLDFEEPDLRGPAFALTDRILDWYQGWDRVFCQITAAIVRVDGERAVSEAYIFDVRRAGATGSGGVVDTHRRGRYLDRWSRRDGRWAIDHRQLVRSFEWKQPVVPRIDATEDGQA